MPLTVKPASKEHLPALLALCRAAADTPGSTWDEFYPNEEILAEDIARHRLFRIVFDGQTVGIFALGDMDELAKLAEAGDGGRPAELARLAIHPCFQGRGFAKEAVRLALDAAEAEGATAVRLLVAENNPAAQAVYKSAGFDFGKTVFVYGNHYIYACKRLKGAPHGSSK